MVLARIQDLRALGRFSRLGFSALWPLPKNRLVGNLGYASVLLAALRGVCVGQRKHRILSRCPAQGCPWGSQHLDLPHLTGV
jgi:hypothetical protein